MYSNVNFNIHPVINNSKYLESLLKNDYLNELIGIWYELPFYLKNNILPAPRTFEERYKGSLQSGNSSIDLQLQLASGQLLEKLEKIDRLVTEIRQIKLPEETGSVKFISRLQELTLQIVTIISGEEEYNRWQSFIYSVIEFYREQGELPGISDSSTYSCYLETAVIEYV